MCRGDQKYNEHRWKTADVKTYLILHWSQNKDSLETTLQAYTRPTAQQPHGDRKEVAPCKGST